MLTGIVLVSPGAAQPTAPAEAPPVDPQQPDPAPPGSDIPGTEPLAPAPAQDPPPLAVEKPAKPAAKPPAQPAAAKREEVTWNDDIEQVASARYPKTVDDLRRLQTQVQAVVKFAEPAVVAVQVGDSVGSGVIVSEDGLVLTAGHVAMEPNRPVRFMFPDGKRARGVTLGLNKTIDSGMMKITDEGPWPFVSAAKAGSLNTGDWVIGLGQPNGYFRDRSPPVRLGRVLYQDDDVINTDVTLVGGDSGGPLFNLKGEVVGIHSRIGRRITSNFHVPISTYELTWERLFAAEMWGGGIEGEEPTPVRPVLGVSCSEARSPCQVTQVFDNFPASRAGVKVGDVIRKVGDKQVETFAELVTALSKQKPRARITLTVERDGKTRELSLRLGGVTEDFPGLAPLDS